MDSRDEAVLAAYADGQDMDDIARRFGVTPAEIERMVEAELQPTVTEPPRTGLANRGNRILLGVGVGFVVQMIVGLLGGTGVQQIAVWIVVAAVTYAIATPRS